MAKLPPLSPGDAGGFNEAFQQLYKNYRDSVAGLRAQGVQIGTAFDTQAASIDFQRGENLKGVEGSSIDRGVLGSSGDFKARTVVRTQASTAMQDAINARDQALLQNKQQALASLRDFQMGTVNLQMDKANQQAMNAAAQMANVGVGGAGADPMGGGTKGVMGKLKASVSTYKNLLATYAATPAAGRGHLYGALLDAFEARNKWRVKIGLNALTKYDLQQAIYNATTGNPGSTPQQQ